MIFKKLSIFLTLMATITLNIFAADPNPKPKKGIIVVINAPSSSGKTSLVKELLKSLNKEDVKWIQQSLDVNADDEDDSGSEFDESEIDSEDSQTEFQADQDIFVDPNDSMIAPLRKLASTGLNVIYDTVLEQDYINEFILKLKDDGFRVYPVLIYCDPAENLRRLKERNSRSNTPSLVTSEARNPIQPVSQIGQMYKPANESSDPVFLFSPKDTLSEIKSVLENPYPICEDGKTILQRTLSGDEIDRSISGLKMDLELIETTESVAITPRYDYALVIDNSNTNKKTALLLLKTFINEKEAEV